MASLAYEPEANWFSPRDAEAMEARDGLKYEWMDGEIFAMAGASPIHNTLSTNLVRHLANHLDGTPCQVWSSDLKVRVQENDLRAYPDVVVACPPHEWDENEKPTALLNPLVIIEILSPSTQSYDHTLKWEKYRQLSSLQECVLISSDRVHLQHYRRQFPDNPERGEWILNFLEAPQDELHLFSLDCQLPLSEIYERVEFPAPRRPNAEAESQIAEETA